MTIESEVSRHYTHGSLEAAILEAFASTGKPADAITVDDLTGVDEFHIGGAQATGDLTDQLSIAPAMHLLDVGCGIGGPARFLARRFGCRVTGIDLTPEFVAVAESLTRRVGLADRVDFREGSALALPFGDGSFDGATLLHVGMNIADKATLFGEVGRVLKPGGFFAVYDVMRIGDGELHYPMPWATTSDTSFVATPADYRGAAAAAGFAIRAERDRGAFGVDFFRAMRARAGDVPKVALPVLMGPTAPVKMGNVLASLENARLAPVEMICQRN